MELIQDPRRLDQLLTAHHMAERIPWTAAYPWSLHRYEKWEYLCRLREPMEYLLLLLEGNVLVTLTNTQGRTRLVSVSTPGELVGGDVEVVLGNTLATADLRAQDQEVLCAALPLDHCRAALSSDLEFLRYTARRLALITVHNTFQATNDLLFPLEHRLAAYLLDHREGELFQGNLTRAAETLGASYRQLTRTMKRFSEREQLLRTEQGWKILDLPALERLARCVEPADIQ